MDKEIDWSEERYLDMEHAMNTKKHTPTPWYLLNGDGITDGNSAIATVFDPDDTLHLTQVTEANAQFIVKACNSHEELVEALEYTQKLLLESSVPKRLQDGGRYRAMLCKVSKVLATLKD